MKTTIHSFDGTSIEGSRSRSGVFAAFDWERLVLPPIGAAILSKARHSANGRLKSFPPEDHQQLKDKLGHYSDVQSINCEDTVMWSVFGCADQEAWSTDILTEVFGYASRPRNWQMKLWSRIPHPDTGLIESGPESDCVLQNGMWRYVIEAKWASDISRHKHGKDQLEMRAYQAQLDAVSPETSGVIVLVPSPARYPCAHNGSTIFRQYFEPAGDSYAQLDLAKARNARALTWERLVELIRGRGRPRLREYLEWRLSFV